jgi:hypothetical protein
LNAFGLVRLHLDNFGVDLLLFERLQMRGFGLRITKVDVLQHAAGGVFVGCDDCFLQRLLL